MAYDIGPKIGIEGEKQFREAIQQINTNLKTLGTEMMAVTSSFDKNDKSVKGLTEKKQVLNKQIDEQKKKLEELKKGLDMASEKYGENDKVTQGWQQAVNKATADLNKMEKELEETNKKLNEAKDPAKNLKESFSEFGENASKAVEKTKTAIKGLSIAIAAVGGALGGIVKIANDYTKSMNDFQAQTGYSSEQMAEFKQIANDIYSSNLGESFSDIADSMALINQTADLAGDELRSATKNAIMLRDVFGFDIKESINAANSLMVNFGITADEAYNLMAQGAQMGADKNGDLIDTLNEYAPHFAQLGLSAEEFTDTLIQGAVNGAFSIDKIGDAVKEFGIRAKDGSKTSAEGFQLLGLNADEMFKTFAKGGPEAEKAFRLVVDRLISMKDPLKQNQAGVALFGTMFEDLGIQGIAALSDIENYASLSVDALGQINEVKYNDIGSALEGLKRTLISEIVLPVGEQLTPKINEMIKTIKNIDITPIVNTLSWIIDNADTILAVVAGVGAGMITWNVVSMVTGLVSAIKAFTIATEGASIAQAALNVVMNANPIGIIITVIAGLVAAIITLWNTNEDFRNALIGIWDSIANFFTETIPNVFNRIVDFIKNNWQGILQLIVNPFAGAFKLAYDNCEGFRNNINNFVGNVKNSITNMATGMINAVKNLPNKFKEVGSNIVKGLWNGINDVTGWIINKIKGFGNEVIKSIKGIFGIHSPSRVMRDEVGKNLALGIGEGFTSQMKKVTSDMNDVLPTSFDVDSTVNGTLNNGLTGQALSENAEYVLNISIPLDGRELVRRTIRFTSEELAKLNRNSKLALGGV